MMVNLQVKDRINKYNNGNGAGIKEALLDIYKDKSLLETSKSTLTIIDRMSKVQMVQPVLTNFFFIIILFMILLSIILNQSLVQSVSIIFSYICRMLMNAITNLQCFARSDI